jgi:hypothetical protein
MDIVKESKLKLHGTYIDSTSIHLNNTISTGILLKPTSKNIKMANIVVNTIDTQVIICVPVNPIFLPNKPGIIELIKGNIINVKYICCFPLIYTSKTTPKL